MSLRAVAERTPSRRPGPSGCAIQKLINTLDPDDAAWLIDACAGPEAHTWIIAVLAEAGHRVSDTTLGAHRRGTCPCPR